MHGMRRIGYVKCAVLSSVLVTVFALWFALANCRNAIPVSAGYLRGMALSLGQAIESIAANDSSLKSLSDFTSRDIAYFSLIDRNGRIRFHANPDLIGERVTDERFESAFKNDLATESRVTMGTGEKVFESQQKMHLSHGDLVLRLALHTWQADQIIKRARAAGTTILLLLIAAWLFGLWGYRLQQRELLMREVVARKEHLAQLGELGAILAHEVRTPLAGLKGYAQLLFERAQDERQRQYTRKIIAESGRLEDLVNDLLTYARQEPLPRGTAPLEQVLRDAWDELASVSSHADSTLQVTGMSIGLVACPADRLRQLFLNLLSNALQAMPEGGMVHVHLSERDGMARVAVTDNGPGFPPEVLPQVFVPFFTTRANGSGLGLAICRKLVEGYGGTIVAGNSTGGGAEIILKLPLPKESV